MPNFLDSFGDVLIKGIDKRVDSEFATQPEINSSQTYRTTDSGDGLATAGNSTQSFIAKNKPFLMIAAAALVVAVVIVKA